MTDRELTDAYPAPAGTFVFEDIAVKLALIPADTFHVAFRFESKTTFAHSVVKIKKGMSPCEVARLLREHADCLDNMETS